MSYAYEPDLSVGDTREQALGSRVVVGIHLPRAGLNIDGNEFALIVRFDLWANIAFVDLAAASSELLFAITRLSYRHFCLRRNQESALRRTPSLYIGFPFVRYRQAYPRTGDGAVCRNPYLRIEIPTRKERSPMAGNIITEIELIQRY